MRLVRLFIVIILGLMVFSGCARQSMNTSVSKDGNKVILDYCDYLKKLDTRELNSISLAINRFNQIKSQDKTINDDLYRYFYNIYNAVIDNYNDSVETEEEVRALDKDVLEKNGLVVIGGEAGTFLYGKAYFIPSVFGDYVTNEVKEFLELTAEARFMRGEGYMFEDGYLTLTWDEVADLIVKYENYFFKYPHYDVETDAALYNLDYYLYLFTQCLDTITFSYMSDDNGNEFELRDSYTRFFEIYPQSRYHPILKGYFEIINNNGFKFDEHARQYLIKNGIEVMK